MVKAILRPIGYKFFLIIDKKVFARNLDVKNKFKSLKIFPPPTKHLLKATCFPYKVAGSSHG